MSRRDPRRFSPQPRRFGYFVRTRLFWNKGEERFESDGGYLVELTAKDWREVQALQGPRLPRYRRVDATYAHDWVKRGYIHETGLYTEDGRIRYAYDSN